jgi:hypothetical protein
MATPRVCGRAVSEINSREVSAVWGRAVSNPATIPDSCGPGFEELCSTENECDGAGGSWCDADCSGVDCCKDTPYRTVASSGTDVVNLGAADNRRYWGHYINSGQTTKTICEATFSVKRVGTVSGKTYYAEAHTMGVDDAIAPASPNGTSDALSGAGIDTTATTITFVFSTPVELAPGDALVIKAPNTDADNYIQIYYRDSDQDDGYASVARWNNLGALTDGPTSTQDFVGAIYAFE